MESAFILGASLVRFCGKDPMRNPLVLKRRIFGEMRHTENPVSNGPNSALPAIGEERAIHREGNTYRKMGSGASKKKDAGAFVCYTNTTTATHNSVAVMWVIIRTFVLCAKQQVILASVSSLSLSLLEYSSG